MAATHDEPADGRRTTGTSIDPRQWTRWARRAALPMAMVGGVALYLCFGAVRVPLGMDTTPSIPAGSLCLIDKRSSKAQVGCRVFVDLPDGGTVLSKVVAIRDDDRLVLQHEAADSQLPDSDQFGPVARAQVRGVVLVVFPPDGGTNEAIRGK